METAFTAEQPVGLKSIELESNRFRSFIWENLTILVWIDQADLEAIKTILTLNQKVIRRYPQGHSTINFILDGLQPPTPEARDAVKYLYQKEKSGIACIVNVLEGTGFWASALRGSFTGIKLETQGSVALRIYNSIDEAIAWLPSEHEKRTGVRLDPQQLRTVLIAARKHAAPTE